jgi:hypothetical protein
VNSEDGVAAARQRGGDDERQMKRAASTVRTFAIH